MYKNSAGGGEPGAEVYSAATSRHQARIVFDTPNVPNTPNLSLIHI